MSKQLEYLKHPIMLYIVKEHAYIYAKLGVAIGFGVSSLINGSDERLWMRIVTLKSCLFDLGWSAEIFSRHA